MRTAPGCGGEAEALRATRLSQALRPSGSLRRGYFGNKDDARAFEIFFTNLSNGHIFDAIKILISLVARFFMLLTPSFGEFNPGENLSEGKSVPMAMLFKATWQIGLLWTGVIAGIGLALFHRREIARVQV